MPGVNPIETSNGGLVMPEPWDDELVTTVLLELSALEVIDHVLGMGMPDEELDNVDKMELNNVKVEDVVASDTVLVMTRPVDTCEIFNRVLKFKVLDEGIDGVDKAVPDAFKVDVAASDTVFVTTTRVAMLGAIDSILGSKVLDGMVGDVATVEVVAELKVPDEASGAVELSERVDFSLRPDEEKAELLDSVGRFLFVDVDEADTPEENTIFTS